MLKEEKEEKVMRIAEMEIREGKNVMKYQDEIIAPETYLSRYRTGEGCLERHDDLHKGCANCRRKIKV